MLNLLEWGNKIRVNGEVFNNSNEAYERFKDFKGDIKVELNFVEPKEIRIGEIEQIEDLYYF